MKKIILGPPKWQALAPVILTVLERDTRDEDWHETEEDRKREQQSLDQTKIALREQVTRMAIAADLYNKDVCERKIRSLSQANDECTDLYARLENAAENDKISEEEREVIEYAKWAVELAIQRLDEAS